MLKAVLTQRCFCACRKMLRTKKNKRALTAALGLPHFACSVMSDAGHEHLGHVLPMLDCSQALCADCCAGSCCACRKSLRKSGWLLYQHTINNQARSQHRLLTVVLRCCPALVLCPAGSSCTRVAGLYQHTTKHGPSTACRLPSCAAAVPAGRGCARVAGLYRFPLHNQALSQHRVLTAALQCCPALLLWLQEVSQEEGQGHGPSHTRHQEEADQAHMGRHCELTPGSVEGRVLTYQRALLC